MSGELDANTVFGSFRQRLSRLNHIRKAKSRAKARTTVECLSSLIPETGIVLDVGAHHGYWTKEFAAIHHGRCSVFAFEPVTYNFSILKSVVSGFRNVVVEQLALSDATGNRDIYIPVKQRGNVGVGLAHFGEEKRRNYLAENIETIRLDEYVAERAIPRLDFIKCDVEGAELLILKGGENCIRKFDVKILLEIADHYTKRVGYDPSEIFDYLAEFGFRSYRASFSDCTFTPVEGFEGEGDYLFKGNNALGS